MIYLDNAATTKPNPEVIATINNLMNDYFINADSPYLPALTINKMQDKARQLLAANLKVKNEELIFVGSGSEANNMAIKGIAFKYLNKGKYHIITSMIEHASVYESMQQLEKLGFEVTYLMPDESGVIDNDKILAAIKDNTILISLMKINSEVGSINNLETIYQKIKAINSNIVVHCDCVQAFGKYELELQNYDLASFSAHKINGIKGSGLLYKKQGINLLPLISGGQQEFGLRAGTANYYYNIVLAKTLRLYLEKLDLRKAQENFAYIYQLLENDERIKLNSSKNNNSFFIVNFSIPGYKPEVILNYLEAKGIYIATKSACSTNVKRSRVIDALPIADINKDSAFRISFSLETTKEELTIFYNELSACLTTIVRG
ncbi:cysteine desulfurase [Erysipelotrichaceae bacterium OttesenSCG-928-M19]|nr:cysteine desulfurase [Erysipelotrichaceae bacterium OttesenSCG-928-M19]